MAYNQKLADRISDVLEKSAILESKKMFGGVGFLLEGNMCCGVLNDDLILRVGIEPAEAVLASEECARPFDITGRVMKAWVMIEPEGTATDDQLQQWISLALDFTKTLPPKS